MIPEEIITWLLEGDVSIQYQVNRDILGKDSEYLKGKISKEGWGRRYLSNQNINGHWGRGFYTPKWISTHYTLLDLKNLCIDPKNRFIQKALKLVFQNEMSSERKTGKDALIVSSDVCINGMVLNYSSYFGIEKKYLFSVVDYLIETQMEDGGYNCLSTRKGAVHSSLHTTLSVLEGIYEFCKTGYNYRLDDIKRIEKECVEFILVHRLYKSDKTGKIIKDAFTRFPYPSRWKYDILRCLDYFAYSKVKYDERMQDAIDLLISKRKNDGKWVLAAKYPGEVHFSMEKAGRPSRWNTLRALRVLKHYNAI